MSAPIDRSTVDLSTSYLGLPLRSPIVASSSPRTAALDGMRRLEDAGAGAIVLPSLFEEQIVAESQAIDEMLDTGAEGFSEASTFFPVLGHYNTGPDRHLELIEAARAALDIPVIASLNGVSPSGWAFYAALLEESGAHAIELNPYRVAADPEVSGARVEDELVELVAAVRESVRIPLAVKLSPFFSSLPHLARRIAAAGADGLVLFNRFYQPDLDLDTLMATPRLALSSPEEVRLPLRWIGLLHGRVDLDLAASTGIHTWEEAAKVLLAGARVAMMASALLPRGPEHVATVEAGLRLWMAEHGYSSVAEMTGSAAWATGPDPAGFERGNYLTTITSYSSRGSAR